jgi:hypothetical protein
LLAGLALRLLFWLLTLPLYEWEPTYLVWGIFFPFILNRRPVEIPLGHPAAILSEKDVIKKPL